ncbi:exopolyphosphatase, partial [Lactobacillus rhamnosus]|nr:exopolyphosphatase [Lacticaseibacillus rhamnosus]
MENYVVIDLGSNSVRLRITNIADDGTLTVTHQLKEYVRLSENMGQEKTLKQEPIKRTLQALKSFKDIYSKLENPNVNAIATAAVRQAANQKDFLDLVKKKLDLEFNVITGEREA